MRTTGRRCTPGRADISSRTWKPPVSPRGGVGRPRLRCGVARGAAAVVDVGLEGVAELFCVVGGEVDFVACAVDGEADRLSLTGGDFGAVEVVDEGGDYFLCHVRLLSEFELIALDATGAACSLCSGWR